MFNRLILRAMNGKHEGKEFVLENEGDYILGRAKDCSCVLDDPLCLVSRRHCRIEVHAPSVRIRDLGSRNGTSVNGKSIGCPEKGRSFADFFRGELADHPLEDGDHLEIAGYEFRIEFDSVPANAVDEPPAQSESCSCHCALC